MADQFNILSRILAITPVYRGFGFALLEEIENKPVRLVDWGVSSCGRVGNGACHGSLSDVIREARPSAVVLPNWDDRKLRRSHKSKELIRWIRRYGRRKKTRVATVGPEQIRKTFPNSQLTNKRVLAEAIATRFPELVSALSPERQPGDSEHCRMAIFDAVALAVAVLRKDLTGRN